MMSIKIYRHCDTWAFTDLSRGLQDEPFVCGIPEIIDYFIKNFSDSAKETHRIIFSARNFPHSHGKLVKTEMESGGRPRRHYTRIYKKRGGLRADCGHYFIHCGTRLL
jgi:hypothetical protein